MRSIRIFALLAGIAFVLGCSIASAATPSFTVTGPIAATDYFGKYSHNYPFFATNHDLATHGYVEEEFFLQGNATEYSTTMTASNPVFLTTANVNSSGHDYLTRMVVRRPADPKRFNGTVLVEWYNVTNGFDAENTWFFAWEHVLRAGYAWVGVSAQHVGVWKLVGNATVTPPVVGFNPTRYANFNVSCTGCTNTDLDALSFDIFTQAAQALKTVDMLGGLHPKHVIATGESQSAMRLAAYVNQVDPLVKVFDGFLLLSSVGQPIRSDPRVPTWKVLTEYDVYQAEGAIRQPDTSKYRSWEVAGTSHVDQHLRNSREPLELRDMSTSTVASSAEAILAGQCAVPSIGTRVPTQYVLAAAYDQLVHWIVRGAAPASAPPIETEAPVNGVTQIVRDDLGLAKGGIRLSQLAVPTGYNVGVSSGPGACVRWGYYQPFDVKTLNQLYPHHHNYVRAVTEVTWDNLRDGYILWPDAEFTIGDAWTSGIGDLDDLHTDLEKPLASFDQNP